MNYVEGENSPTVKFRFKDDAIKEAERLTELTKKPVYTLKAVVEIKLPEKFVKTNLLSDEDYLF